MTDKIKSLKIELVGPASVKGKIDRILYTCTNHRCIFPCFCLLCNLTDDNPWCEHRIVLHPRFFDNKNHLFTVKNADSWNIV